MSDEFDQGYASKLEVNGYYSNRGDLELCADTHALLQLTNLLTKETTSTYCQLAVPKNTPADPYDGFLTALRVVKNENSVLISRNGELLSISGSSGGLRILAENIQRLVLGSSENDHIHEEYYSGHFFLSLHLNRL